MTALTSKRNLRFTEDSSPDSGNLILRDLLWIVAAGAAGVGVVLALLPAAGHDQLWCLYVAGRMLRGVRLYGPELFESNPPLIMWLSALPVALAHRLNLEPSLMAKLLTLLSLVVVWLLCRSILARRRGSHTFPSVSPATSAASAALALFFAVAFLCVPARDFGQREHLLSFLVLPYLLLVGDRRTDWNVLRTIAGVLAAIGICLKPQQALMPIAVETFLLLRHRGVQHLSRAEPVLLGILCVAYVTLMRLLTPEYFLQMLPILRGTYWAIGHLSPLSLLRESLQVQALAVLTIGSALLLRRRSPGAVSERALVFLAAGLGSDLAYLLQGTGWYYQQIPAIVFFMAAGFLQLGDTTAKPSGTALPVTALSTTTLSRSKWLRPGCAALGIAATFLTLHASNYPVTRDRAFQITSPNPSIFQGLPPGTPVAILTTSVDEAIMPVARYHLLWAQRTNNLWWMPALLRKEAGEPRAARHLSDAEQASLAALQRCNMAEDLQRWRPELVLIERCQDAAVACQVMEDLHPDLLRWFAQSDQFRFAFAAYSSQGTSGRFDIYRRDPLR